MSSENGSEDSNGGALVCRDYLRNVCRRGKRCKFSHPNENAKPEPTNKPSQHEFCHDYQNAQCIRDSCRFLHGSKQDEEYYTSTGNLPSHLECSEEDIQGNAGDKFASPQAPQRETDVPVCKDHLKGACRRAGKCRFRHLPTSEYERETSFAPPPPINVNQEGRRRRFEFQEEQYSNFNYNADYNRDFGPTEVKRRTFESQYHPFYIRETSPVTFHSHHCQPPPIFAEPRLMTCDEENALLRKRMEELKKQVSDLTATNEFLLDQNAQLRMSGKRTGITMPSVTITNAGTSVMQVQPMTAQIQSSSIPTSAQHLVSAAVAGTLRTVTASVATVPVSIATVAGTPVSIATVSMAPVQMQPPIVTMAQTITVDGAHSSQLNGGTASLLSYPIMTHDLRPVLQTSLTH